GRAHSRGRGRHAALRGRPGANRGGEFRRPHEERAGAVSAAAPRGRHLTAPFAALGVPRVAESGALRAAKHRGTLVVAALGAPRAAESGALRAAKPATRPEPTCWPSRAMNRRPGAVLRLILPRSRKGTGLFESLGSPMVRA